MIDVSIIIVNYNTRALTLDCLKSVYRETKHLKIEVIVIDNASSDGSADAFEKAYPKTKVIRSAVNVGFGNANNLGIEASSGKYLFLLNSDTLLKNNAIKIFYGFMESRPDEKIGCAGAKLLDTDERPATSYGGFHYLGRELKMRWSHLFGELLRAWKLRKPKIEPAPENSASVYDGFEPFEVETISGADMFIPRKTAEETGMFDKDFFMYSEEVEWQYRMAKAGWKRIVIPGPKIVHLEGKSFTESNRRRIMYNVSKFLFFKKHSGGFKYRLYRFLFLASVIFEMFVDLFRRRYTCAENRAFFTKCRKMQYF
ncbi:MAG: hypothetical protein A2Y33_07185 [Spirochaetes bacterium GWF1_51_8]|nr:MAG: hypothetical protein A2Y33_07185 [Spirochaetes bacterium GWF1_51_8]